MKKLISLIAIIALVSVAVFAATDQKVVGKTEEGAAAANTASNVDLKITVDGKMNATFRKVAYTAQPTDWADLVSDAEDLAFTDNDREQTVYIAVQTNELKQTKVALKGTPLKGKTAGNDYTITYTVDVAEQATGEQAEGMLGTVVETTTIVTNATVDPIATFETEGKNLRLNQAMVTVTLDDDSLDKAPADDYVGTFTLVVTANS
ncbi:MAG: hypothetical protein IJ831_05330 [Spirochaetales bacterium]|nr:hypothetical protein [Spirochaetales bacterium]